MEAALKFAKNLAGFRQRAGLTQEELGLDASIHPTWISHLESGRTLPRLDTVAKLAAALDVEARELLTGIRGNR